MMESISPRTRSLLRQAEKIAQSGKRTAAVKLYRQILDEAPQTVQAWTGLSDILRNREEKETALLRALEIAPDDDEAKRKLAILRGEIAEEIEEDEAPKEEAEEAEKSADIVESPHGNGDTHGSIENSQPLAEVTAFDQGAENVKVAAEDAHQLEVVGEVLFCANHPNRETHLRCNKCGKPICSSCAQRTPVGYRCPECIREHEEVFFTATIVDYVVAILIALPLSIIAGAIATRIGFLVIFLAAAAGSLIGRLVFQAVRRRRGRWLPLVVGGIVVLGGLIPATPFLLGLMTGQFLLSIQLLWTGIYVVMAAGAAYYQMR